MSTNAWKALTGFFGALAAIFGSTGEWRPILFPVQETVQLTNFVNRIVEEGGRYTIPTDSIQIELIVHDVSVVRRSLKVEISLSGGVRQSVQFDVNKETPVALGSKVYVLVAHDVYNGKPDIAVLSIMGKRS